MNAPFQIPHAELGDEELRAELRQLIKQRDAALTLRDRARDAADRANAFVASLEESLATFDGTDNRIASERAQAFKRALAMGDAKPMLSLSPELSAIAAKRLDVANELNGARQAQECLASELAEAQQTLNRLQADTERAARAVVAFYADAMARQLADLERRAGRMRQRLLGVTAVSPRPPFPVAASTVALLRDSPANHASGWNSSADDTRYWDSWRERLTHDSEALPDD